MPATDGQGWRTETWRAATNGALPFLDRAAARLARLRGDPARLPQEARIGFTVDRDADGRPLSGSSHYVLILNAKDGALLGKSWSVAVYDGGGGLPDRMSGPPFVSALGRDASQPDDPVTITIQSEPPDDPASVWLGAPPGPFRLVLRVWEPGAAVLKSAWRPSPVQRRDRTA